MQFHQCDEIFSEWWILFMVIIFILLIYFQHWDEFSQIWCTYNGYTPLYQSPVIPIGTMSPNFQTLFQPPIVPIGTTGPMFLEKITNTYFFVKCLFSVWFFHYVIICNGMCYILSPVFDIVFSDNYRACCTRLNRSCLTGLSITN